MAGSEIDQIKERIEIVELIQEYLQLKQSGTNWKGLCPFHNEKSPSFMVSQDKQIWHCFGCDKGGDIFAFIQEMEGIEFVEALRLLAKRAGVQLEYRTASDRTQTTKSYDALEAAEQFYSSNLRVHSEADTARTYLAQRGIKEDIQKKFGVGYSLTSWDALIGHLTTLGYGYDDLFAAGLTIKKESGSGYYDRFRGRVMFPFHDVNGVTVGFTARTLQADEPGGKYINSPQSAVFDKSRILYGLHLAKQPIKQLGAAIIVEGNVDVITAHQAGFSNVIATSGTAFTDEQMTLLKRYSHNMLLAFDMDSAGIQATQRSIEVALRHAMNIKVMRLPEQYKDPDECIQNDPAAFKHAVRSAQHIIDFYFDSITKPLDLSRVEHKKKAVAQLVPIVNKIVDPVEQSHYVQRLADLVRVEADLITQAIKRLRTQSQRNFQSNAQSSPVQATNLAVKRKATTPATNRFQGLSQQVLSLVLGLPQQFKYCVDNLDPAYMVDPASQELYKQMVNYYNSTDQFDRDTFQAEYLEKNPEQRNFIDTLDLLRENIFETYDHTGLQEELISSIKELHKGYILERQHDIEYEVKAAEQADDTKLATQLLEESKLLNNELESIS